MQHLEQKIHRRTLELINVYTALMEYNETRDKAKYNIYKQVVADLHELIS